MIGKRYSITAFGCFGCELPFERFRALGFPTILFTFGPICAATTPMVTLSNDPNTWGEHQLHESNLDEETETCVSVRDHVLFNI